LLTVLCTVLAIVLLLALMAFLEPHKTKRDTVASR